MIGSYRDIIIAPVITEQSAKIAEKGDKIVSKVRKIQRGIQSVNESENGYGSAG